MFSPSLLIEVCCSSRGRNRLNLRLCVIINFSWNTKVTDTHTPGPISCRVFLRTLFGYIYSCKRRTVSSVSCRAHKRLTTPVSGCFVVIATVLCVDAFKTNLPRSSGPPRLIILSWAVGAAVRGVLFLRRNTCCNSEEDPTRPSRHSWLLF